MSDGRVKHWIRVPDKSTLNVSVTGTTKIEFVLAILDWLDSANNGAAETLDSVRGDPVELRLRAPRSYSADVVLTYQTGATATVKAEIITPSGERHGKPYSISLKGKAKQMEFVSFFIFTQQA